MKKTIKLLETAKHVSPEMIFKCFQKIGDMGDIVIFKIDGERVEDQYTVVISSPNMSFEAIRYDASTVEESLLKALKKYVSIKEST